MSLDKITVDEALISTDVDQMIRTVAERKRISLHELQQLCKIDKKTMDKWIRVLEDEGYIRIEYGLGGTFIMWAGMEYSQPSRPEVSQPDAFQVIEEARPMPAEEKAEEELVVSSDAEPEELLSRYVAQRKEGTEASADKLRDSILTSLDEEAHEKPSAGVEEAEEAQEEEPAKGFESEEPVAEELPPRPEKPVAREKPPISIDTRALVNSYMEEIAKEKAEIEKLKKAKASLYRDKFNTVEGKMEADLVAMTELIIEKQSRVAELKERVLELPDRVDEVGRLQEQLDALRNEGRGALQRTREKADGFLTLLSNSKTQLKEKVSSIDGTIDRENDQVEALERAGAAADARLEKMHAAVDSLKVQLEEFNNAMSALTAEIEQTNQTKADVSAMTDELKATVAAHGAELDSLQAELDGIAKIERWVKEYVADYEKKLDDIEQYVARSDENLAELKESAESLYMRKYLNELEGMTQAYQGELDDAMAKEEDIDQQIAQSKARISELVRDSQEMIRKLRSDPSLAKDFDSLRTTVRSKTDRVATVVEEKMQERTKLTEETARVRKTKVEARAVSKIAAKAVAKAKARPVSKAAKKKKRR